MISQINKKLPLLYVGLSEYNLCQLKEGKTILIEGEELHLNRDIKMYLIKPRTKRFAEKFTPIIISEANITTKKVVTENT